MTIYHKNVYLLVLRNVIKLIVDPYPGLDRHPNIITSRASRLDHAYMFGRGKLGKRKFKEGGDESDFDSRFGGIEATDTMNYNITSWRSY